MLDKAVETDIHERFGAPENTPQKLHGGDINDVYLIHTTSGPLVIKTNTSPYPGMFPAEAGGLDALGRAGGFRVPKVLHACETYLALEYIAPGPPRQVEKETFGNALATLHQNTSEHYGWSTDNYIGSLPQSNNQHTHAADFYRDERLLPQFRMAQDRGFKFRDLDAFLPKLEYLIPDEPASLIHGDLWGGNFMVSTAGEPCLIDPAVSYAPREMDLAMTALFGGFPRNYTETYNEVYPLAPEWKERVPLWQLYYILVHLNLFGAGYYSRCMQIIKKYV